MTCQTNQKQSIMTNAPRYYTEKKRETIVYSRFNATESIKEVTMVGLGPFSMQLSDVKMHMFNERIGDWKMLRKTKSENKVKKELEMNFDEFMKSF